MGLIELSCSHCSTVFYGVLGRDTHCHICKTIIEFQKAFDLEDLVIEDISLCRIREPEFGDYDKENPREWRNYIPEGLKAVWQGLPIESRALAIMFAEREARAIDIISSAVCEGMKRC